MDDPAALNRRLNKALRLLNLAAVSVAEIPSAIYGNILASLVESIAQLSAARQTLIDEHPELDYHFDHERAPTAFMCQIHALERDAENALLGGSREAAISILDEALNLEPPALDYEILEKRRNELLRNA
ncbi:MAG: hypothetical protein ACM31P_10515 [Actinomycetota bacterium]